MTLELAFVVPIVVPLIVPLAFFMDWCFGEPKRFHPLVGFGRWAKWVEAKVYAIGESRSLGVLAVIVTVFPLVCLAVVVDYFSQKIPSLHLLLSAFVLYLAIGWQSLLVHAQRIVNPLSQNDLTQARNALAMIVSRDTQGLGEKDIAKAATESVLENGADAIFCAVFWFCLLGIPGVVLYRLCNTLDAMWGYKNQRYIRFGWFAARVDDVLNYLPARCTALSYAAVGNFGLAIKCWREQGGRWKSPNAGPVMASGAGAIRVSLGGEAQYHGQAQKRPQLGPAESDLTVARWQSIHSACALINRATALWLALIVVVSFVL